MACVALALIYIFDMCASLVHSHIAHSQLVNKLNTLVRHPIKYVSWSKNHKYVALLSKFLIYICDNQLKELCMINETSRIKSACWDSNGVLIYTTASHIKFCLTNGTSASESARSNCTLVAIRVSSCVIDLIFLHFLIVLRHM